VIKQEFDEVRGGVVRSICARSFSRVGKIWRKSEAVTQQGDATKLKPPCYGNQEIRSSANPSQLLPKEALGGTGALWWCRSEVAVVVFGQRERAEGRFYRRGADKVVCRRSKREPNLQQPCNLS